MEIIRLVEAYQERFPEEIGQLEDLRKLLAIDPNPTDRHNYHEGLGHLTASCLVLGSDLSSMLLIDHKKLKIRVQPGGHIDPDETPFQAAIREAKEETRFAGVKYLSVDPENPLLPCEWDIHVFPSHAATSQPEHLHHDMRYVVVAESNEFNIAESEVEHAGWYGFDEILNDNPLMAPHVQKLIRLLPELKPVAIQSVSALQ